MISSASTACHHSDLSSRRNFYGDEPWFSDSALLHAFQTSSAAAHAEQRIWVGPPAEEVRRVFPGGGQILGAGAILRLGGSQHMGFGETDIGYAYRQLSRVLHPDKNPEEQDASAAFQRLIEAAEELRRALSDARATVRLLCAALCISAPSVEELERPQMKLFAEATRVLSAVLAATGEGTVPSSIGIRSLSAFVSSPAYGRCDAIRILTTWFDQPQLLDLFSTAAIRAAYDCSPKRFRLQFLCTLHRVMLAEAKRNNGCIRQNWQAVTRLYPEMDSWQFLRQQLQVKVSAADAPSADSSSMLSSSSTATHTEQHQASAWAIPWREAIRAVLPSGYDGAALLEDVEVQRLVAALWEEVAVWAASCDFGPCLKFFGSEKAEKMRGRSVDEWAFVPAIDLLLVIGDGLVGHTAEGLFVNVDRGHVRGCFRGPGALGYQSNSIIVENEQGRASTQGSLLHALPVEAPSSPRPRSPGIEERWQHDLWDGDRERHARRGSARGSNADAVSWACAACTYLNVPSLSFCEVCETPRDATRIGNRIVRKWMCAVCTFKNDPDLLCCEMCQVERGAKAFMEHVARTRNALAAESSKAPVPAKKGRSASRGGAGRSTRAPGRRARPSSREPRNGRRSRQSRWAHASSGRHRKYEMRERLESRSLTRERKHLQKNGCRKSRSSHRKRGQSRSKRGQHERSRSQRRRVSKRRRGSPSSSDHVGHATKGSRTKRA